MQHTVLYPFCIQNTWNIHIMFLVTLMFLSIFAYVVRFHILSEFLTTPNDNPILFSMSLVQDWSILPSRYMKSSACCSLIAISQFDVDVAAVICQCAGLDFSLSSTTTNNPRLLFVPWTSSISISTRIKVCRSISLSKPANYSVSQKNIPDIFSYNSKKHRWILIIFGTHITQKVGNK